MEEATPDPVTTKQCRACREIKPIDAFYRMRRNVDLWHADCKECRNQKTKAWKQENPDRVRGHEKSRNRNWAAELANARARRATPEGRRKLRNWRLKKDHGITLDEYEQMVSDQGGVCKICRRPPRGGRTHHDQMLHVDHDHATGRIRGLLCRHCNVAIGFFDEDVEIITAAIRYIQQSTRPAGSDIAA
jgi:hypothetical protein